MRKIWASISLIAIVVFAVGFGVSKYNSTNANENPEVYTLQEALSDDLFTADFNVEEKSLAIQTVNPPDVSTSIAISKEDEQKLINAMEQWKLTEYVYNPDRKYVRNFNTYSLYLTINTGYRFYLELEKKLLSVTSSGFEKEYNIQNGDEFFTLLENAIQKSTH